STMESKFVALVAAGKEAEWLRNLIHEILIWPKPTAPISIHCDSAATLAKAYSQIYNERTFGLRPYHFTYPKRRLAMEEMLYKFIDEGKREQEEMKAFSSMNLEQQTSSNLKKGNIR
ncbi:hypothetical protein Tco_1436044, partial [Tanacetum coccineum]